MTKPLVRPCPVCLERSAEVLHTQHFAVPDEMRVVDEFDVVGCSGCGFVFADIATRQDVIDKEYKEHSKYADGVVYVSSTGELAADDVSADPPWDLDRLRETAAELAARFPDRSARVLDAGCATGALLGFLQAEGFDDLVGLDPSPTATATAHRAYGVEVYTGSFLDAPPVLGSFDLIVLSHVLEHIADVRSAVSALKRLLADGGSVYIEVPDARHYASHLVAPFNDFNTEHINHFSLPTLRRLMLDHGFDEAASGEKIIMCSPSHTYPAVWAIFRPSTGPVEAPARTPDEELLRGVREYVDASRALMVAIDEGLQHALLEDESVILWGAGQLSMKLLRDTCLAQTGIVAIIDGSPQKQGLHLEGHEILPPSTVSMLGDHRIVVTSVHLQASILRAIATEGADPASVILLSPLAAPR